MCIQCTHALNSLAANILAYPCLVSIEEAMDWYQKDWIEGMVLTEYLSTITNTWIILQELHRREFWTMLEIPPDMSRLWMGQSVCFYMWKSILGVGSVCLSVSDFPGGFYAELPKFCTAGTPRNSRNHFCRCRNGCCLCMQFKIIDGNGSGICLNCRKNSRRSEGMIQQKSSLGILTWNNADTKALTMERSVTTQAVHNHLVHKIWVPTHPLHVHKGSNQMRWWWCLFFSLFFLNKQSFHIYNWIQQDHIYCAHLDGFFAGSDKDYIWLWDWCWRESDIFYVLWVRQVELIVKAAPQLYNKTIEKCEGTGLLNQNFTEGYSISYPLYLRYLHVINHIQHQSTINKVMTKSQMETFLECQPFLLL